MRERARALISILLAYLARAILARYRPRIIAVTGSVGKTTTKEAIATTLSPLTTVRKSEKSFNSDFGIPLAVIGIGRSGWNNPYSWGKIFLQGLWLLIGPHTYPKWLVLEVGAGKPGDIARLTKWLRPHVAIVTRFPEVPAHIEFFKTREALIEEKTELIRAVREGGSVILNYDDEDVRNLSKATTHTVFTYGFSKKADLQVSTLKVWSEKGETIPLGLTFKVAFKEKVFPVAMRNAISQTHVYAGISAILTAAALGFDPEVAAQGLVGFERVPGRLSLVQGIAKTLLIDDTYNASPASTEAALDLLTKKWIKGRKIAVLGDMLELGRFTKDGHTMIGHYVKDRTDLLVTVGKRALDIAAGAIEVGCLPENVVSFETTKECIVFLQKEKKEGDVILIKGSQGMRMERIVEALMANPEQKEKLLVRQEKEWRKK